MKVRNKTTLYWNIVLVSIIVISTIVIGWKMTSMAIPIESAPETFVGTTQNRVDPYPDIAGHLDFSNGVLDFNTQWYKAPKDTTGYWYNLPLSQIQSENIIPAYCLQYKKANLDGEKMIKSTEMSRGYVALLENGWPNKSITGNNAKDFYITQVAVWMYVEKHDPSMAENKLTDEQTQYFNTSQDDTAVQVRKLIQLAENATEPDTSLSLGGSAFDNRLYYDTKEYYKSDDITVESSSLLTTYTVDVSGASGIRVVDMNGNQKATFSKGEKFRVMVPASSITDIDQTISVKVTGNFQYYSAYRYVPEKADVQLAVPAVLYEKNVKNTSTDLKLTIYPFSFDVIKVDSEINLGSDWGGIVGGIVGGARLEIQKEDGTVIDSWTTTDTDEEEAYHRVDLLEHELSNYYLVEKEAPEGYVPSDERINLYSYFHQNEDVRPYGILYSLVVYNTQTRIEVSKIDEETGELIAGATLVIKDENGNIWGEPIITSNEPTVIRKIPIGTYTIEEIEAPDGYVRDQTPITFQVDKEKQKTSVVMANYYIPILIKGQDLTIYCAWEGYSYIISDRDGKEIDRWDAGKDGENHTFKNLPLGEYTLELVYLGQTESDEDRDILLEFTITDTNESFEIKVPNGFTKVAISKKDITNDEELPGATL